MPCHFYVTTTEREMYVAVYGVRVCHVYSVNSYQTYIQPERRHASRDRRTEGCPAAHMDYGPARTR